MDDTQKERDTEQLIQQVLEQLRRRGEVVRTGVYHDQPLLRTGAQLAAQRALEAARQALESVGNALKGPAAPAAEKPAAPTAEKPAAPDAAFDIAPDSAFGTAPTAASGSSFAAPGSSFAAPDSSFPAPGSSFAAVHAAPPPTPAAHPGPLFGAEAPPWAAEPSPEERRLLQRYQSMRQLCAQMQCWRAGDAALFYRQACLMADMEDHFEYRGEFIQYYPTYQAMNSLQLRGYFTWRAQVRRGEIARTSLAFAFVYVYELLMLVGASGPVDAWEKLRSFWRAYRLLDARLDSYMHQWMLDFVLYYDLDDSYLMLREPSAEESARAVLYRCRECEPPQLFEALITLSSYDIRRSRLYTRHRQDLCDVACRTYTKLSEYCETHRRATLFERLYGRMTASPYRLFDAAVFWDHRPHADCTRSVGPMLIFRCSGGQWTRRAFYGPRGKSRELGAILKTVDCMMREAWGVSPPIKPGNTTALLQTIVRAAMEECRKAKQLAAVPAIDLDPARLEGIRRAAAHTRDRLLATQEQAAPLEQAAPPADGPALPQQATQEQAAPSEQAPMQEPPPQPPAPSEQTAPPKEAAASSPAAGTPPSPAAAPPAPAAGGPALSPPAAALLHALLYGGDCTAALRRAGVLPGIAADDVNAALFDTFGDTVIVFDGETPRLLEDYIDDLKRILPP